MFSSPDNEDPSNSNLPKVERTSYILHKNQDPVDGVDTGRSRKEVVDELNKSTAEFVQELKDFIRDQKLENDVAILNVLEFIGMVVIEATPEGRKQLEAMENLLISENGEVHLIEPVEYDDLHVPKRPDPDILE